MYLVKVKTPVYFNNKRHEIGEGVEIENKDMDENLFEILEEIEEIQSDEKELDELTVPELKEKAKEKQIEGYSTMKKEELIKAIEEIEGE